jgi:propionyl-CoA synthetase
MRVVARDDDLKGQVPMGLVMIKSGMTIDDPDVIPEIIEVLRSKKMVK